MLTLIFSFVYSFVLCSLAISGVIFEDVYTILKLENKEEISIDELKFEKCILPYKSNSQTNSQKVKETAYEQI